MRANRIPFLPLLVLAISVAVLFTFAGPALAKKKKKKKKKDEPPAVGLVTIGDWTCYSPPDFAKLSNSDLRVVRAEALDYLMNLVNGKLDESFQLKVEPLLLFETAFLGRPQLLDGWLADNFVQCKATAEGKSSAADYLVWLGKSARELEEGECYKPLTYEYHNFLDIESDWQYRLHVCKGNKLLLEGTGEENGQYTISDTGKPKKNTYITAAGDPAIPEAGDTGLVPTLPAGALIMRFEAEDQSFTKYILIGLSREWEAPEHGFISFAINDTTYFDNEFRNVNGAIDYLGIDIYPPVDETDSSGEGAAP
ncbi:MAG: hypothetical protein VX498_01470 [Myxococcota bacterium]|nr:hypothetical protein [Myxococcota bacterium]